MHVKSEGRVDWFSLQSKLSPAMHGCGLDHYHDWMGQKVGHCPQVMNNSCARTCLMYVRHQVVTV